MILENVDRVSVIRNPLLKFHRPIEKINQNNSKSYGLFFVYAKDEKYE
jgi:hypothetical protein